MQSIIHTQKKQKMYRTTALTEKNKRKKQRSICLYHLNLLNILFDLKDNWKQKSRSAMGCGVARRGPDLGTWPPRHSAAETTKADSTFLVSAFFLFLYFSKSFFTKIYFRFHNLQIYTPTARQEVGRPAALLPGGRDLNVNKIYF